MKLIIGIAAALALVGAAFVAAPTAQAQSPWQSFLTRYQSAPAAPVVTASSACKTVTDGDIRGYNLGGMYSFGMSWTHAGFASQQYVVERSDDAGATWYTVQSSTAKSYSVSGMGVLGDDVRFRLSTANCDTAGVVFTVDPPSAGYYNQDIY